MNIVQNICYNWTFWHLRGTCPQVSGNQSQCLENTYFFCHFAYKVTLPEVQSEFEHVLRTDTLNMNYLDIRCSLHRLRKDLPCFDRHWLISTSCVGEPPRRRVRMFLPGDCAASWLTLLTFPSSQRQRRQRFIARHMCRFESIWPVKICTILQWNVDVLDIVKARRLAHDRETIQQGSCFLEMHTTARIDK